MASLLALVLTSLIGMLRAVSRLCYAAAQDDILPERFAHLSDKQIPVNTLLLILLISLPIPLLGRTPIGWIVDTTTIGATFLYGFVSAAVLKVSKREGKKVESCISTICMAILVVFLVLLLFPSYFSDHTIETETYALMTVWSLIGLFYFNAVIRKDSARNFGKAIIVWMALLAFIVLMAMTWTERYSESKGDAIMDDVYAYMDGTADSETQALDKEAFIEIQRTRLHNSDNFSGMLITGLFGLALGVLLLNHLSQQKWEKKAMEERDRARTAALTDPMTGVKSKHAFLLREKDFDTRIKNDMADAFAIAVCDVNGLKKINDTLGHKAGDAYIIKASRVICDIFQHSRVFRTGGEEFVVIMTGRDYLSRKELVQELHDRSAANISTGEVVISGGLSDYRPGKDTKFHEVFERADASMYEEKKLLKSMGAVTREDFEVAANPQG